MIADVELGLFLLTALIILLIPGPAVTFILTRSVAQGRRVGLASVAGVELASGVYAVAATIGLSTILLESALAFDVVKYVGVAYLVYLGTGRILSKRAPAKDGLAMPPITTPIRAFASGFVVNIFNPKTALFFVAFLPQFVAPSAGDIPLQILTLGLLWVVLASCTDSAYAIAASAAAPRLGRWLSGSPKMRSVQRYTQAGVYIGLAVAAALEQTSGG
jgi:threonine/homoserine/homoserine lactone efflux protein